MHGPPAGPTNPALHVHYVAVVHPVHDAPESAGQATHAEAAATPEYCRAAQDAHAVAPATLEYVPSPHHPQIDLPMVAPYDPSAQSVHTVARAAILYLRTGHSVHAVAPAAPEYWPAAQFEHTVATASEYWPTGHVHTLAPASDDAPTAHAVHADAAAAPEYVPTEQLEHAVRPPETAHVPAAQSAHVVAPVLYRPAGQSLHAVAPAAEYLPPAHAVHLFFSVLTPVPR